MREYRVRLSELQTAANVAVGEAKQALTDAREAARQAGIGRPVVESATPTDAQAGPPTTTTSHTNTSGMSIADSEGEPDADEDAALESDADDADKSADAPGETEAPAAVAPPAAPHILTFEALAVQRAEVGLTRAKADRNDVYEESRRYAVWFDECASSMLWMVGDDVARRLDDLETKMAQLRERRDEEAPPAEALKSARKTLIRWWQWTVPIWLVVGALLLWWRYGDYSPATEQYRLTTEGLLYSAGALLLLSILILGLADHAFYKAMRTYEHAVDMRLDRIVGDKEAYVYTGREIARLTILSSSLKDWTRIIGETIWRPWTKIDEKFEDLPDDVIDALPAAMGIARPATGDEAITAGVVRETVGALYRPGWAHRNFEIGYSRWESEHSLESDDGFRSVDVDVRDSESSPRRLLRDFWAEDHARAAVTHAAVTRIRTAVEDGEITLPARVVRRVGRFGDGKIEPERNFYDALATESTTFAIDLFVPAAQHSRLHYVDRSIAWLPAGAAEDREPGHVELRQSSGTTAVRVDTSRRLSASELVTFRPAAPATTEAPSPRTMPGRRAAAPVPTADDTETAPWH